MWIRILISIFLLPLSLSAQSKWAVDIDSSFISFHIRNFGMMVDGSLSELSPEVYFDPKNLGESSFSATILVSSIDTGNKKRDKHLKSSDYFDADHYPTISFQSNQISGNAGSYKASGQLKIKNTKRNIELPFEFHQEGNKGKFTSSFTLDRLDYEVGKSSWVLSDQVRVRIAVHVTQTIP